MSVQVNNIIHLWNHYHSPHSKNTPIKSELKRKNKPGRNLVPRRGLGYGHGLIKIYTIPTLPNVHIAIR